MSSSMKLMCVLACAPSLLGAHLLRQQTQLQASSETSVQAMYTITANGTRLKGQGNVDADVTICMEAAFPPFNDFDPVHGGLWGFDVELVERVCKAAGVTCAVVTAPFTNAWPGDENAHMGDGFLNHQFDCITGSGNTKPRRSTLKFSDPYTQEVWGAWIGHAGQKMFKDASTVHIGTIRGRSCGKWYVKRVMPEAQKVTEFFSGKEMIEALDAGSIDVALTCPIANAAQIIHPFKHEIMGTASGFNDGLAFMCHPQSAAKIVKLNEGLKKIRENGELETICKQYPKVHCDFNRTFGPDAGGVGPHAHASDLTIAMEASFPPFNDFDPVKGLTGFDVDLVPLVCEAAGITCSVVTAPWKSAWPGHEKAFMGEGFLNHEFDCITGAGNTLPRHQTLKFSNPYTQQVLGAFVGKKGMKLQADASGTHIGTVEGFSCGSAYAQRTFPKAAAITEFPTDSKLFEALAAGSVEVALTCPIVNAKKRMNPATQEIIRTVGDFNFGLAFMCHPGEERKVAALNYGMQKLVDNGKLKELCQKYPDVKCDISGRKFSDEEGGVEVPKNPLKFDVDEVHKPHSAAHAKLMPFALAVAFSAALL